VLVVRPSQLALFVNEGRVADVFTPGSYRLTTQTLPLLTNLRHWDKLFASPFKSDVYFFSTRQQVDQKWGTAQPVTLRDAEFGTVRLRAFGNFSYRVADAQRFHTEISGTRESYDRNDLDGQLRALVLQALSQVVATSGVAFIDLAANQLRLAQALQGALASAFEQLGLALETVTVQNVSLPDELQKVLDQKIGMGMVGNDLNRLMQYQTAQAIPALAQGGGMASDALGLGAGIAMGQVLAQNLTAGMQTPAQVGPDAAGALAAQDVPVLLEQLAALKDKGILTQAEFDAQKTQLLGRLK